MNKDVKGYVCKETLKYFVNQINGSYKDTFITTYNITIDSKYFNFYSLLEVSFLTFKRLDTQVITSNVINRK